MKVPDIADVPCIFRDASEGLSAKMQLRVHISQVRYTSRELDAAVQWEAISPTLATVQEIVVAAIKPNSVAVDEQATERLR